MKKQRTTMTICTVALFVLILDTKTVITGAKEGIELCLYTVVPSLFPFFIISTMLNASLWGLRLPGLRAIGKFCHIPVGAESVFLLGSLGGYPVGAKSVDEAFRSGQIDRTSAVRMLGFCSNCGPSFIFGICGSLFTNRLTPWLLWMIQIISALLTGHLLPKQKSVTAKPADRKYTTIQASLNNSVRTIAQVCGWIVVFRVIITLINRWVLWSVPRKIAVVISGILELANGCTSLSAIGSEPIRFILCSCLLSFGGICIMMQTISVTHSCGMGWYVHGKLMQTGITIVLSIITASILYTNTVRIYGIVVSCISVIFTLIIKISLSRKKDSHTEKLVV